MVSGAFRITLLEHLTHLCEVRSDPISTTRLRGGYVVTTTSRAPSPSTTATIALSTSTTFEIPLIETDKVDNMIRFVVDDSSAFASDRHWQQYSSWNQGGESLSCGYNGWRGGFTYSETRGQFSSVTFPFKPPADGCYLVEEFHPADECNRPMSRSLTWSIHFGRGQEEQIDVRWKSKEGDNRWNIIGLLPFYNDTAGKIVVGPADSSGWVVADAFALRAWQLSAKAKTCLPSLPATDSWLRIQSL